jgi:hypothetical protein
MAAAECTDDIGGREGTAYFVRWILSDGRCRSRKDRGNTRHNYGNHGVKDRIWFGSFLMAQSIGNQPGIRSELSNLARRGEWYGQIRRYQKLGLLYDRFTAESMAIL